MSVFEFCRQPICINFSDEIRLYLTDFREHNPEEIISCIKNQTRKKKIVITGGKAFCGPTRGRTTTMPFLPRSSKSFQFEGKSLHYKTET